MISKYQELKASHHRFIFIGGLHRSGTSTIFQCLREHPLVSGFKDTGVPEDEGQHLQSIYRPAIAYGGPGRFGFDPEAHLDEYSDLATDDNGIRLFMEWARYWDLEKPALLEKSPSNLLRTRFLQELFPNSYFVILMRHPVAVAYATQKWTNTSMAELIEHWLVCHEKFEQDKRHIRRLLVLRYEDFVENTRATLAEIYSFVGLPDYPNKIEVHSDVNRNYFRKWQELRDATLSRDCMETARFTLGYEPRVAKFGYSLDV
jgi:hypothetical protein